MEGTVGCGFAFNGEGHGYGLAANMGPVPVVAVSALAIPFAIRRQARTWFFVDDPGPTPMGVAEIIFVDG